MSVAYGGSPGGYVPSGKVNFGWIGEAFELFKANAAAWIVAALMLFVVPAFVGGIIGGIFGASAALHQPSQAPVPLGGNPYARANPLNNGLPIGLNVFIQVLSLVYTAYLYGGIYRMAVKQVRGEPVSIGDIFSGGPLFLNMLGFQLLYLVATVAGTALCIVPGLLISGLLFPGYALIADGETIGNTISRCTEAMRRDLWNAAGFILVMGLLILASYFAFCLGEFVTMPMLWLVSALAYRDMIGMPGIAAPASPYGSPYGAAPGVWPPPPGAAAPPFNPPPYNPSPFSPPPAPPETPPDPPRRSLGGDPLDNEPRGGTPPS